MKIESIHWQAVINGKEICNKIILNSEVTNYNETLIISKVISDNIFQSLNKKLDK